MGSFVEHEALQEDGVGLIAAQLAEESAGFRVDQAGIDVLRRERNVGQTGCRSLVGSPRRAILAGEPDAIGNGGRYDGIGKAFGRARPATGFTLDLRQLAAVVARQG